MRLKKNLLILTILVTSSILIGCSSFEDCMEVCADKEDCTTSLWDGQLYCSGEDLEDSRMKTKISKDYCFDECKGVGG